MSILSELFNHHLRVKVGAVETSEKETEYPQMLYKRRSKYAKEYGIIPFLTVYIAFTSRACTD